MIVCVCVSVCVLSCFVLSVCLLLHEVTPDLKTRGGGVLLFVDLGQGSASLGGSSLAQVLGQVGNGATPDVDVQALKAAFQATQRLLSGDLITAGHDRSDGGMLVAVLEMAFASHAGVALNLPGKVCVLERSPPW